MGCALEGSYIEKVNFCQGRTEIPQSAFENAVLLKELAIPDSVTKIGAFAFKNCESLENIEIPEYVTEIGAYAFENCDSLTEFTIPESVTSLKEAVFLSCDNLKTVLWNHQLKAIFGDTFKSCSSLSTFKYPETTQSEPGVFAFPDVIEEIRSGAFEDCDSLLRVTLPDSVNIIGEYAFSDCNKLEEVILPDSVSRLEQGAFYNCDALKNVKLGKGLTKISRSLFETCDALESIEIPNQVTEIEYAAFRSCIKLVKVTIFRNVKNIEEEAFSYPRKMTIYGVEGSYAQTYAEENGCKFVPLEPADYSAVQEAVAKAEALNRTLYTAESLAAVDAAVAAVEYDRTAAEQGEVDAWAAAIEDALAKLVEKVHVTGVSLNQTSASLKVGDALQLVATVAPSNADNKEVTWSSSNIKTAAVDKNGKVTAVSAGEATITVKTVDGGKTATCKVTVTQPIKDTKITLTKTSVPYTGSALKPKVTIEANLNGKAATLKEGTHYTLAYKNNINAGTATVTITGKGYFTGTATKNFKITAKKLTNAMATIPKASYVYTGKAITPAVVKDGSKTLKKNTDYTISYSKNTAVGTATVTVKGKGNYAGTVTKTFTIIPKATTLSTVTGITKGFNVKWAAQKTQTTGYQILYSTDKTFKSGNKTVTVPKNTTTSKKIINLKAKTTYYVRVRTYKTVGGKKYYSAWSKAKAVKTK